MYMVSMPQVSTGRQCASKSRSRTEFKTCKFVFGATAEGGTTFQHDSEIGTLFNPRNVVSIQFDVKGWVFAFAKVKTLRIFGIQPNVPLDAVGTAYIIYDL